MSTPLHRIYAAIGRVARSDDPIGDRRDYYRQRVEEATEGLSRDELVKLVHDVGALLESSLK